VKFIDAENIDANTFQVTDEFEFGNGSKTISADVVFLINGVPVFLVETKAAHKIEGMAEALEHIRRYHRECPEVMAMLQVYAITHIIRYYYSATWRLSEKTLLNWKEDVTGDYEILVKTFFDRDRAIRILHDFILFTRQMRAVNHLLERAKDKEKRRGLIWHTQGSGKTYTMIVTAQKILENPVFDQPTVIMLVDRTELESQLFGNLNAIGVENVKVAESKEHLRELLERDARGLIVTISSKAFLRE
jgi:type I restriction enzyme R subunit